MTLAEVIDTLQTWIRNADDEYDREEMGRVAGLKEALHEIKRIEPCEDAISRQAVLEIVEKVLSKGDALFEIEKLPSVAPQPKTGQCKHCEHFDLSTNKCLITGEKCYENKECLPQDCKNYKKGEWCSN